MSEEEITEAATEEISEEPEPENLAPGLAMARAPPVEQEGDARRRRGPDPLAALRAWQPRTRLGRMVMNGMKILGKAPMIGVLRAAEIESVAIARWTSTKFVVQ